MTNHTQMTIRFGDLVVAAFDEAATHSTNRQEVSWMATRTVMRLLRGASQSATRLRASLVPGRWPES